MARFGSNTPLSGAVIASALALSACGWSALPYPRTANELCSYPVDSPPPRAALWNSRPDGCFNLANLGAMLAEPRDLERGRELAPANGERAAQVVDDYQAGQAKVGNAPPSTGAPAAAAPGGTQ